mgnify:CR=1 FL=1
MPLDVLGQGFVFFAQFLRAVLAENAVAGVVGRADRLAGWVFDTATSFTPSGSVERTNDS